MADNLALDSDYVYRFIVGYVDTALWSSTDDDFTPLDENYTPGDIATETKEEMREDCESFIEAYSDDLQDIDAGQAGHDLWLTRNHHGAGFWSRDLGELGDRLTEAAHAEGTFDLYVGDDGTVYGS
jgi:hypothetical protein